MAAGFYETMKIHEVTEDNISHHECCVATSVNDYVNKALRLGNDDSYREKVSRGIKKRAERIVDDKQTNFEWLRFLFRVTATTIDDKVLAQLTHYKEKDYQTDAFTQEIIVEQQIRWKTMREDDQVF